MPRPRFDHCHQLFGVTLISGKIWESVLCNCMMCPSIYLRPDWASAKTLLGDPNFLNRLINFDKVTL